MAKDYAKFVPSRPKQAKKAGWRKVIAPVFILFFLTSVVAGYFTYQKKSADVAPNPKAEAFAAKITALFGRHKKETPTDEKTKPKAAALAQNEVAPPVQFDFYSELPKLQVTLPETAPAAAPPRMNKPANNVPPVAAVAKAQPQVAENSALASAEIKSQPELVPAEDSPEPQSVFKPEELDQILAHDETAAPKTAPAKIAPAKTTTKIAAPKVVTTKADQYLLHLGSFDTQKAAKIWCAALIEVGFRADIIKGNQGGHVIYHVRQGPFANAALAKVSQQKLQRRGIASSVIKKL